MSDIDNGDKFHIDKCVSNMADLVDQSQCYRRWANQYIERIREMQATINQLKTGIDERKLDETDVLCQLKMDNQLLRADVQRLEMQVAHLSQKLAKFYGPHRK